MTGKQIFDDWPERYDRWFETPLGKAVLATERELILDMLQPRKGELILDAGSGTGIFTEAFITRGADVVGLDISFAMLRRAAEKNAALAGRGVAADMTNLPFAADVFDKTVSVTAIEFIADAKRAVAELFRVTKRGGIVVVATLNSLSPWAERRLADARRDPDVGLQPGYSSVRPPSSLRRRPLPASSGRRSTSAKTILRRLGPDRTGGTRERERGRLSRPAGRNR